MSERFIDDRRPWSDSDSPFNGSGGDGGFGGGGGGARTPQRGIGGFGGGDGTTNGGGGAGFGGGIFNNGGTVQITNSTVSGNTAIGGGNGGHALGGGLFNRNGTITILNATFANNTADDGGGSIYNLGDGAGAIARITNSILADTADGASDFQSTTINGGIQSVVLTKNIIESNAGLILDPDPKLGPLNDNGGSTLTHALQVGSPAIDAGNDAAAPPFDQRGIVRPQDGNGDGTQSVDIGAVEFKISTQSLSPSARDGSETAHELAKTLVLKPDVQKRTIDTIELVADYSDAANRAPQEDPEFFISESKKWHGHLIRHTFKSRLEMARDEAVEEPSTPTIHSAALVDDVFNSIGRRAESYSRTSAESLLDDELEQMVTHLVHDFLRSLTENGEMRPY